MKLILSMILASAALGLAHADQTATEKAEATGHAVKRSIKKGAHRMEEKFCAKSDTECLTQKAKHRASEASDYTKDKAHEAVDKAE